MTLTTIELGPYGAHAPNSRTTGDLMRRGRPVATKMSPIRATIAFAALLFVASGCDTGVDIPDVVREPEIAGEIERRADLPDGPLRLTVVGGAEIELDRMTATNLRPGTDPNEGDLFLYGTEPDGPWFWSGPLLDDRVAGRQCAGIAGPALEEGDAIVFEIGLRLPKAPDFDPAEQRDGVYSNPAREFCIDEHGEVTRFGL